MSITDESRERRSGSFRRSMDIGMGLFYTVIGSMLVYARSFGNLEDIPRVIAYLLGRYYDSGRDSAFLPGYKKCSYPKRKIVI